MSDEANDRDLEREYSDRVQSSRLVLINLLTPEERETPRGKFSERDYRTFEDVAAKISKDPQDERCFIVAQALELFQAAVNALWEHAYVRGYHERLARMWCRTRVNRMHEAGASFDDVAGEVLWVLRRFVTRYDWRVSKTATLVTYAFTGVMRWLDEWAATLYAPLDVPRKVRRGWRGDDWLVAFRSEFRERQGVDPLMQTLEEFWTREWSDSLEWLQACRDALPEPEVGRVPVMPPRRAAAARRPAE